MKQTSNLKLSLYEHDDFMDIIGEQNSLNHNTQIIDENINSLQQDTNNLNTRLDNLILNSGDSSAEVVDARVDSDGKTYTTLKERLDIETSELKSDLADIVTINRVDLLIGVNIIEHTYIKQGVKYTDPASFFTLENVALEPNKTYVGVSNGSSTLSSYFARFINYKDAHKNYLENTADYVPTEFTTPNDCYYADISMPYVDLASEKGTYSLKLKDGSNIETLDFHGRKIPSETIDGTSSVWSGKKYISHGDSITWYDGNDYPDGTKCKGYQSIMNEQIGFDSYNNQGWSGHSMADGTDNGDGCVTRILGIDHSNYDLCTIACGTNDFKLNVPLGTLGVIGDTSFNRNTFYGAYRTAIEYLLNQKPKLRLVLFTPLQRDNSNYDVNYTNSAGHKLIDYVNAIKSVGEMYGLPVCDMYSNSGFTKLTLSTYTIDGLHPSNEGFKRMGNYATQFVNSIGC